MEGKKWKNNDIKWDDGREEMNIKWESPWYCLLMRCLLEYSVFRVFHVTFVEWQQQQSQSQTIVEKVSSSSCHKCAAIVWLKGRKNILESAWTQHKFLRSRKSTWRIFRSGNEFSHFSLFTVAKRFNGKMFLKGCKRVPCFLCYVFFHLYS